MQPCDSCRKVCNVRLIFQDQKLCVGCFSDLAYFDLMGVQHYKDKSCSACFKDYPSPCKCGLFRHGQMLSTGEVAVECESTGCTLG